MTIVNLRGTHGSGKSTVARAIIDTYKGIPRASVLNKGKPLYYEVECLRWRKPLFIIGPYETQCGGCDAIQPYSRIWPIVESCAQRGHVLFEGALISTTYGSIGQASEVFGNKFIFAFLDTPLKTCIKRIEARRKKKGNLKPLNTVNTEAKFATIVRLQQKLTELGRQSVWIDHKHAVDETLRLFK